MVLPIAALLAVVFGGWEAVVTQTSSVVGISVVGILER